MLRWHCACKKNTSLSIVTYTVHTLYRHLLLCVWISPITSSVDIVLSSFIYLQQNIQFMWCLLPLVMWIQGLFSHSICMSSHLMLAVLLKGIKETAGCSLTCEILSIYVFICMISFMRLYTFYLLSLLIHFSINNREMSEGLSSYSRIRNNSLDQACSATILETVHYFSDGLLSVIQFLVSKMRQHII